MTRKIILKGEIIFLRPLGIGDVDGDYVGWLNDPEVCKYNSHGVFPYNKQKAVTYIKRVSLAKDMLVLAIVAKKEKKHIGNISLQHIDVLNNSAEYAILLGDKNYWGQGIAKKASLLILKHGFRELNLHRIYCGTAVGNIAMQKLAESLGMKLEGRRRDAQFKNGQYNDVIEYGVLREEFLKKFKK